MCGNLDNSLFHFINASLSNSLFDRAMPFFSDTPFFPLILIAALVALICKGGARGRICAVTLALGLALGDGVMCNSIKHAVGRLRPFHVILDAHVFGGRTDSFSMPSSHAANWFCATLIAFIYYRRSIRFMLPLALLVSFSRIYNGVHYPSDVLAGMILGAGCGAFLVWAINALWQITGPRWFPIWHQRLPSLASPVCSPLSTPHSPLSTSPHWLNLGYVLVVVIFLFRLSSTSPLEKSNSAKTKPTNGCGPNILPFLITANRRSSLTPNSSAPTSGAITNSASDFFRR